MKTVKQMLGHKPTKNWCVSSVDTVFKAAKLMAEKDIGALLVMENGNLVGIISERDIARKSVVSEKPAQQMLIREIMTTSVISVSPDKTIEECMELMTEKGIRHLPVLFDDRLVGIISIRDIVKEVLREKEFWIKQLENYITGREYCHS